MFASKTAAQQLVNPVIIAKVSENNLYFPQVEILGLSLFKSVFVVFH